MIGLVHGLGGMDLVYTAARVAVGVFFAFSGYHKLFNPGRHAALVATLKADRIPFLPFNAWFVPLAEFIGGTCLVVGFLTVPAAIALTVLLTVAMATDGYKRVKAFAPIDVADTLDDWLYLSEVVYIVLLALIIAGGPGPFSIDSLIF